MGYLCISSNHCESYIEISPLVWECPICKRRYHEYGYENTPILLGDYSNIKVSS
jgi:hypothetical protein